jgi:uncharacterized protein YdeI (YjbR/CyaY-like superfamily)
MVASKREPPKEIPIIRFQNPQAWAEWLRENHAATAGVWLQIAKINSEIGSVTYDQAIEVALCYGWIDSQKKAYDQESFLQKFTPRGAKSIWSVVNRGKAEALILNGQMQPAGLTAIERAKQNGQWEAAYEGQSRISVPDDFQAELDKNEAAKAFFATLNRVNRYAILFRIQTARQAETRSKRIQKFIAMLERHELIHP